MTGIKRFLKVLVLKAFRCDIYVSNFRKIFSHDDRLLQTETEWTTPETRLTKPD